MGTNFLQIFASSPFKSIKGHMIEVLKSAEHLSPLVEAALHQKWDIVKGHHTQIQQLEEAADELKKQIRLHLPNTLLMPVSRFDLLELLSVQDKIANQAKDIASLFLERRIVLPQAIVSLYLKLQKRSQDACVQAKLAVDKLDELLETGFRGHEVNLVERMILELDKIEQETDNIQAEIRQALFAVEKEYPPVDVIFYYKLVDLTAQLANCAQRVGHRLQLLLAH